MGSKPFRKTPEGSLATRSEQEILDHQDRFYKVRQVLYGWDVWAAVYLNGGGCSDRSFIDPRARLIAQVGTGIRGRTPPIARGHRPIVVNVACPDGGLTATKC